ncbi:MAG: metallophosphoesterase [Clostridia bacterium]|nr:metallophosphoesterase [Clostridia bacterium]
MTVLTDFSLQMTPGKPYTILQLTDMQFIDASQKRYPERLSPWGNEWWQPENLDRNALSHIRNTVKEVSPDLIVITGDMVYGEFDDNGSMHRQLCACMGAFGIPWAPVFGNHDCETAMGVDWQCELYSHAPNCLFARGNVTGNSNYTIGLYDGDTLCRVLFMMDANCCFGGTDPALYKAAAFGEDQVAWVKDTAAGIREAVGHTVPAFLCCHIPPADMHTALVDAGYAAPETVGGKLQFRIGEEPAGIEPAFAPAHPGDMGYTARHVNILSNRIEPVLIEAGVDGIFCGHCHETTLSVAHGPIRYTFGVKCGTFDHHIDGLMGGTRITLPAERSGFMLKHLYEGEMGERMP